LVLNVVRFNVTAIRNLLENYRPRIREDATNRTKPSSCINSARGMQETTEIPVAIAFRWCVEKIHVS
jgi:hypothetical protein